MDLFVTTLVFNYNGGYEGGGMRCGVTVGVFTHGVGRRPAHLRRRVSNRPVITYRPLLIANNNNFIICIQYCSYNTITFSQTPIYWIIIKKYLCDSIEQIAHFIAPRNKCFLESRSINFIVQIPKVCRCVGAWGNGKTITISFYC